MATKTIYVPDEDLQVFDKAKEVAGDSLSGVVIQSLKDFILKKELEEKAFVECKLWTGSEDLFNGSISGNFVRFYGRKLSKATHEIDQYHTFYYELYITRKNIYLLYIVNEELNKGQIQSSYKKSHDIRELIKYHVPQKLITDAEKAMPGIFCEDLDI